MDLVYVNVLCVCVCVKVKAKGQEVFSRVSDLLGVKELHFFGLSVLHGTVGWELVN